MNTLTSLITSRPGALLVLTSLLGGCSSQPQVATAQQADLDRFMGAWYVIAHIPTFVEDEAYKTIESCTQNKGTSEQVMIGRLERQIYPLYVAGTEP